MSIAQKFSSACELALKMPDRVADFIEIDKHLKRRFREESLTDVLLASFLKLPTGYVRIHTPPEAKTGSDFDLYVTQKGSTDLTHYRIQAKRLCDGKTWSSGRYHCLDHRVKSTGKLQADTLCGSPAIPLYVFYNHANVVASSGGTVDGISLADGFAIQRCVHKVVAGDKSYKTIGRLAPLFFPFSTILCPTVPGRGLAQPRESENAVREAIQRTNPAWPPPLTEEEQAKVREAQLLAEERGLTRAQMADASKQVHDRITEPDADEIRSEVLQSVNSTDEARVQVRNVRRPRVILIGPGDELGHSHEKPPAAQTLPPEGVGRTG